MRWFKLAIFNTIFHGVLNDKTALFSDQNSHAYISFVAFFYNIAHNYAPPLDLLIDPSK